MRYLYLIVILLQSTQLHAAGLPKSLLSLNVFDQLQGTWEPGFREKRMKVLAAWIRKHGPDLVVLQEAQGKDVSSSDVEGFSVSYPYQRYVHEMTGADGQSYGYWMGAKRAPVKEWSDGFAFPDGVARKTQAALWKSRGKCLGVIHLHLSYQNNKVRETEARWIESWIKERKQDCANWIVAGDFNADADTPEMQHLFASGLVDLVKERKPTVGAFNPIRRIYGDNIPSKTIDWTLGTGSLKSKANGKVVFDKPVDGEWLSDHAGIWLPL